MKPTKYSSEYLVAVIVSVIVLNSSARAELTPPYFNLAEGRHISATATCGVGTDGPELYCKLVGANTEHDNNQHQYELIQGQVSFGQISLGILLFYLYQKPIQPMEDRHSYFEFM